MEPSSAGNSTETNGLLRQLAAGDQTVWGALLARHQGRLRHMIALRLDQRLRGRFDASDVLQEAYLRASVLLADYLRQPTMPFFLWLRLVTGQQLAALHRRHLATQARDAAREVPLPWGAVPEASSAALAAQLLGREPPPCDAATVTFKPWRCTRAAPGRRRKRAWRGRTATWACCTAGSGGRTRRSRLTSRPRLFRRRSRPGTPA